MNHSVVVSDVFEKTLYSIAVRKRYCRNVSVSNDGMVAILSDMDCFVLNPYTKDVFYLSINSNPEIEDDELKSKNKKKQVPIQFPDLLNGKGNPIPVLCQWAPKGFGGFSNPLLLTADLFPVIRIWTFPSSFLLKQMEVLCDLSEVITSSDLYQQSCSSVTTIQAAFCDYHPLFAVSVEVAVFFFSMTCAGHEVMIQFQGSFTCNSVVTSLCWLNDELILGTASGGLLSVLPRVLDSASGGSLNVASRILDPVKEINPSSDAMEEEDEEFSCQSDPKIDQKEGSILPFQLQGGENHSFWTVSLESQRNPANVEIRWNLASIQDTGMPLQPSIQHIQPVGECLLVCDGVQIGWIDTQKPEINKQYLFCVHDGVAFCDSINETPIIHCITKRFHYQVIDISQSQILIDYSITSDFSRYSDVIYLGSSSFHSSAILVASQVVTSQRTTSVDMTRQLLVLKSYGQMNTPWHPSSVVLTQQMARESFPMIWEQLSTASIQELQCVHVYVCTMMRQGKPWWFESQTDAVDRFLLLRRRLWLEALRLRSDSGSQWICRQLEGFPEEKLDEYSQCECCGEMTFLHKNHASWCLLSRIDDYCPLSFRPIPTGERIYKEKIVCFAIFG